MKEIKAPNKYDKEQRPFVFLAGSIEMGAAIDWQKDVVKRLKKEGGTILNPRRNDWNKSWEQSVDNPKFKRQVEWELDGLDTADYILMYFDPKTKSPISLLELGLFHDKNIIVCCPDGFWRKGNVQIVCEKFGIYLVDNIDELMDEFDVQLNY